MSQIKLSSELVLMLEDTFGRCGLTPAMVEHFCGHEVFSEMFFQWIHRDRLIIDCDAAPRIPAGWELVSHRKYGKLLWGRNRADLFLVPGQREGLSMRGRDIEAELKDRPVLNANVLDFLVAHPHFVPIDWHGTAVFFWGSVYRNGSGKLAVRGLMHGLETFDELDLCWEPLAAAALLRENRL